MKPLIDFLHEFDPHDGRRKCDLLILCARIGYTP